MTALHVVRAGAGHPVDNMARDEWALGAAREPTLRIYAWRPAGVSIGWFQARADFADAIGPEPIVRRATGGGAIHHEHEITFALAGAAALLPSDAATAYRLIHGAIAEALRDFGVPVAFAERGPASPRPDQLWCFAEPTCHDLVTARGKIVGSAQRRTRRDAARVLHHGSIVLRPPRLTPACGSVAEHVEPDAIADDLAEAVATAIGRSLRLPLVSADDAMPPQELARARVRIAARLDRR